MRRLSSPPRVTFDTSCGLNLHLGEPGPEPGILRLLNLGLSGRIYVAVTPTALLEVTRSVDPTTRHRSAAQFEIFPVIELGPRQSLEGEQLTHRLQAALFPNAREGSRTWDHNMRDCAHIAAHIIGRGDLFVTLDKRLLRKAAVARDQFGVHLVAPSDAMDNVLDLLGAPITTPSDIAIRSFESDDTDDLRRVFAPLSADYPGFDSWLTDQISQQARITVGLIENRVQAAAVWKPRGSERVVKLSAFRVDDSARQHALGPHLLWYLVRHWVDLGTELAYVTVSSTHRHLVSFFSSVGFLIQGVAAERYRTNASELVMAKYFIRQTVDDQGLPKLARELAERYFGVPTPDGTLTLPPEAWFLPPATARVVHKVNPERGTIMLEGLGTAPRVLDALDLERIFHPLRLNLARRPVIMVPIKPTWADQMMRYATQQQQLFSETASGRLVLRTDNAYFCHPRHMRDLALLPPIVFYVSAPVSALVGEARVLDYAVDTPDRLLRLYGDLGVYSQERIEAHVALTGDQRGRALGLHFGLYVPFHKPVGLHQMRTLTGRRNPHPQSLTLIGWDVYERIRNAGGLRW